MSAKKTISKKKATYKNSGYYFDDCPVCRAVAKAEEEDRDMTLNETKEAFRHAGGTVMKE